ncbi:PTS fructose transporter subunit IIB [Aerococcus christensenii]|uniref:PTS fructose transporter subunit IIB n=1 Tax=Aerococcus christensenii TaxID=87541 RepID=UPI0023A9BCB5|nr:PTS fructose transporter subunit IIB [Aerococcus christensenii]WEB70767.1 PTS fructose transporter subunit IIB [Aerococcus christensenii]
MNIVGICACVAGIAHTYLAQENLLLAGKKRGHKISIETQGVIGQENKLTEQDIENADVVILACDVSVSGLDRFKGKRVVEVPTKIAVKNSEALIQRIEEMVKGS